MRDKKEIEREKMMFAMEHGKFRYDLTPVCPDCRIAMKYIFGEMFECPSCKRKEATQFGKVRDFLSEAGPQPAIVINEKTGVPIDTINGFLREGRIEIPDGSPSYIKCQNCGTDIRYGRFCPECTAVACKELGQAMLGVQIGEKPTRKGKMHVSNLIMRER